MPRCQMPRCLRLFHFGKRPTTDQSDRHLQRLCRTAEKKEIRFSSHGLAALGHSYSAMHPEDDTEASVLATAAGLEGRLESLIRTNS